MFYVMLWWYLLAILPDMLKSRDPMALVIEETRSGTIRHFSILKITKRKYYYKLKYC